MGGCQRRLSHSTRPHTTLQLLAEVSLVVALVVTVYLEAFQQVEGAVSRHKSKALGTALLPELLTVVQNDDATHRTLCQRFPYASFFASSPETSYGRQCATPNPRQQQPCSRGYDVSVGCTDDCTHRERPPTTYTGNSPRRQRCDHPGTKTSAGRAVHWPWQGPRAVEVGLRDLICVIHSCCRLSSSVQYLKDYT